MDDFVDQKFLSKKFFSNRVRHSHTSGVNVWDIPVRFTENGREGRPYKANKNCPEYFRDAVRDKEKEVEIK